MGDDKIEDFFSGTKQEFFPGSKKRIPETEAPKKSVSLDPDDPWDKRPKVFNVKGEPIEFFGVGALAKALNRSPVTIRLWERQGTIPRAQYKTPDPNGKGGRRLYTRDQIEGMMKIAAEEGILLETWKPVSPTRFTERVIALFVALSNKEK